MGHGFWKFSAYEENIVALCDVDFKQSAPTFKEYPKAKVYKILEKMFEKDIDAVIATPDHNHAVITMMAIKLGKHVYCQSHLLIPFLRQGKLLKQQENIMCKHKWVIRQIF